MFPTVPVHHSGRTVLSGIRSPVLMRDSLWRRGHAFVVLALCAGMMLPLSGCSNRPSPALVKKDKSGEEEFDYPVIDPATGKQIGGPKRAAAPAPARLASTVDDRPAGGSAVPAGAADDGPVAVVGASAGSIPFDARYLPTDSELVLSLDVAKVIRSPLMDELTGGDLRPLGELIRGLGVTIGTTEWLRIGIRNLEQIPMPPAHLLTGNLQDVSIVDLITHPDIDATIVIKSSDRVELSTLEANGEKLTHANQPYYRLRTHHFVAPCVLVQNRRFLIIARESTIQGLIDAGDRPPQPAVDLAFTRPADVMIALVPRQPEALRRWLPAEQPPVTEKGAGTASLTNVDSTPPDTTTGSATAAPAASSSPNSPDAASSPGTAPTTTVTAAKPAELPAAGSEKTSQTTAPAAEIPAVVSLLHRHATGIAVHLNVQSGVAMSMAVRCDTDAEAGELAAAAPAAITRLQESVAELPVVPAGLRSLVQSMRSTADQTVAVLSTAVPPSEQRDTLLLPGLLLYGATLESTTGGAATTSAGVMSEETQPQSGARLGELAAKTLLQGVLPIDSSQRPDGLELRAMAQWKPSAFEREPRQIEIAVVVTGGLAARAVSLGHIQLETAEVNRISPLKWLGSSPTDISDGGDPVTGFVSLDRGSSTSVHPVDGVLAVYSLTPPAMPAASLRRFVGSFEVRHVTASGGILIARVAEAAADQTAIPELTAAGIEIEFGHADGRESIDILHDESSEVALVQLVQADGSPIADAVSTKTARRGQVLHSLSVAGPVIPKDIGLQVVLKSDLQQVTIPFEFVDLPIPNVGELSPRERSLLTWTAAETGPAIPAGLFIDAQVRWDDPIHSSVADTMPGRSATTKKPYRNGDDKEDSPSAFPSQRGTNAGRPPRPSAHPLRVLVDLSGPLAETIDALGNASLAAVETDLGSPLVLEQITFREENAMAGLIPVGLSPVAAAYEPPRGLRLQFLLTPPAASITQLTRFSGSVSLRTARDRRETVLPRVPERSGKRLSDRELTRAGVALIVAIEDADLLIRVLEGDDDQLSQVVPVDAHGDPIPGVTTTRDVGIGPARGRRVHRLTFAGGIPASMGLKVVVNSGASEIDVPFRFSNIPVPASNF